MYVINFFKMQQPGALQAMTSPRVLEAIQQIQNGIETLRREAPHLLPAIVAP